MLENHSQLDSLSVILAAYKEAENLEILLPRLKSTLSQLTPSFEILVIDSIEPMDNTTDICKNNAVRCLKRRGGNNYGDAIRTGIAESIGEFVIVMDADGSHPPEFIPMLWNERKNYDIVIASRYINGGHTENPWVLVFLSRILNYIFKKIVQLPVLDVSNSFRLYHGMKLRSIQPTYQHFDILEEILARLFWETNDSITVIEVPFSFEKRHSGKSKRNLFLFGYHLLLAMYRLYGLRRQFLIKRRLDEKAIFDKSKINKFDKK